MCVCSSKAGTGFIFVVFALVLAFVSVWVVSARMCSWFVAVDCPGRLPEKELEDIDAVTTAPVFERVTSLAGTKSDLAFLLWNMLDTLDNKDDVEHTPHEVPRAVHRFPSPARDAAVCWLVHLAWSAAVHRATTASCCACCRSRGTSGTVSFERTCSITSSTRMSLTRRKSVRVRGKSLKRWDVIRSWRHC